MSKKDNKNLNDDNGTVPKTADIEELDEIKDEEDGNDDELEQLKEQLTEAESNYKRALADYQNLQKRVNDQRSELMLSANRDLLLRILSVLDTLSMLITRV
jgi:molecular chaperone GrpE